jgi:hypothetical protein
LADNPGAISEVWQYKQGHSTLADCCYYYLAYSCGSWSRLWKGKDRWSWSQGSKSQTW